jgi:hypothetical protein
MAQERLPLSKVYRSGILIEKQKEIMLGVTVSFLDFLDFLDCRS